MDKDNLRIKELEARIEEKVQYIKNFKEAWQRNDWAKEKSANTNYEQYKRLIKERSQYRERKIPAIKAILFDKYDLYKAKLVTKTKLNIKEYKVSITYNYNIMKFYVL